MLKLFRSLGGFLFILGGILATIVIILSGITYMFAGGNPQRLGTAKNVLKAGIIGSVVIFGAGLIISTIRLFTEDPLRFFQ